MAKEIKLKTTPRSTRSATLAGISPGGSALASNEGVFISTEYYRNDIIGKPYPGQVNYITQRYLAYNSTIIRAIVALRTNQIAMLPHAIVPSNDDEPTRKANIFDYNLYEINQIPAFDYAEKKFLKKMYRRVDPDAYRINKQTLFEDMKDEFTGAELATITHLQEKHDDFYEERDKDIDRIKKLLDNPDPWFTDTNSWSQLVRSFLFDLITIDRGVLLKLRDESGVLRGLLSLDGASVRPLINEYGFYDEDKAYVQINEKGGIVNAYLPKRDVIVMKLNPVTDMRYFGYGISPMETLFTAALSDIYIDKGQLDFYRKGGSIPEGVLSVAPPTSRDGMISHMDQETIESMQRHLQAIMAGDYTQLPIFSGGKVTYTDFKGKRRDMQYKELAEYMARKICAVLQVSPQDVGITGDVNRSSGEVQQDLTRSKGLLPLMNAISEYITQHVILEMRPQGDLKLSFKEDDTEKQKNEWTINQQQLISGVMSINEYRVAHGKTPVPWGNTPLQGIRNWKEEDEESGGIPGLGGPPGMPPGGGLPPLPGMMNPGGPVGGENPGAGRPPMDALKSTRFFALHTNTEEEAEELMIKGFSDMYQESSNFVDLVKLHDIHNYPGGEWMRTPAESYVHFADSRPHLGIHITLPDDTDERDVILLSAFDGSEVTMENGRVPIIKSMAQALYENHPQEKKDAVTSISRNNAEEALEKYIYTNLDAPLQEALYKDYYRFKSFSVSDAQVEEIAKEL